MKFDAHYSLTTVDPPEVIYFMREHYPDVAVEHPGITMWDLIVKKGMPPTRIARYCCDRLYRKKAEMESLPHKPPRKKRVLEKTFHKKFRFRLQRKNKSCLLKDKGPGPKRNRR